MEEDRHADRIAGATLVTASAGIAFAMAHHPTRLADASKIMQVHGILDLMAIATAYGLFHMALRRGLQKPAVLAGSVFYGVALIANLGATVVNGFVLPQVAPGGDGLDYAGTIRIAWAVNQTLATMGVFGTGAAFLLWSLGLLRDPRRSIVAIGVFGMLCGAVPIVAIVAGELRLHKHSALLVYVAQALWTALIGGLLWKGYRWAYPAAE